MDVRRGPSQTMTAVNRPEANPIQREKPMTHLEIRDLVPAFGAEVSGFDPHAPLDDDTRRVLQHTFDRRGVLVFRGLDLTHAQQVRFSKFRS